MSLQLPEPVRSTMQALAKGLRTVLGDHLVGVYLGGSLAQGDFSPLASDIDFLVVTDGRLSLEDSLAVALLHKDLLKRHPYAARLEGDYAPQAVIVPQGTTEPVPGCEHGRFLPKVGEIMLSADNIRNMREFGIAFYGPPAKEILPPVTDDQVREAVREMLHEDVGACQSGAEAASAVLNLARSACAIETGAPTTKAAGANWALAHLESEWHPVIQAALCIRQGESTPAHEQLVLTQVYPLSDHLRTRFA